MWVRMWRNQNTHTLLVVKYKMVQLLCKTIWQLPYKEKHRITIWPSNSNPSYTPKRNENICPHKNFYMDTPSSLIHNSQNVETTQMFVTWWMNKNTQTMEQYFSIKKMKCKCRPQYHAFQKYYVKKKKLVTKPLY